MEMRARREESAHVDEFVLHAALDLVDELMWTTPAMALKVVDRFNDQLVSAFVTASGVKFLLLHETRNDDTVKAFFHEVHELYVKVRGARDGEDPGFVCQDANYCFLFFLLSLLVAADEPLLRARHTDLLRGVRRSSEDTGAKIPVTRENQLIDTMQTLPRRATIQHEHNEHHSWE